MEERIKKYQVTQAYDKVEGAGCEFVLQRNRYKGVKTKIERLETGLEGTSAFSVIGLIGLLGLIVFELLLSQETLSFFIDPKDKTGNLKIILISMGFVLSLVYVGHSLPKAVNRDRITGEKKFNLKLLSACLFILSLAGFQIFSALQIDTETLVLVIVIFVAEVCLSIRVFHHDNSIGHIQLFYFRLRARSVLGLLSKASRSTKKFQDYYEAYREQFNSENPDAPQEKKTSQAIIAALLYSEEELDKTKLDALEEQKPTDQSDGDEDDLLDDFFNNSNDIEV